MITINSLKEDIEHCLNKYLELKTKNCNECATDHLRLGIWLKELECYRNKYNDVECFNQAFHCVHHEIDKLKEVNTNDSN